MSVALPFNVPTVGADTSPSCPDIAIYGVRGSGQENLASEYGMGPEVHVFADELLHRIPSTDRVLQIGVPYPAAGPGSAVLNGLVGDKSAYNQSVLEGAQLLVDGGDNFEGIGNLVVRCPSVSIVIAGISQGAQVISVALAQASAPTPVTARIKAVILFASPVRVQGQAINVGDDQRDGIFGGADAQPGGVQALIPTFLYDHTRSYCLTDDPICSYTLFDLEHHRDIHTSYAESLFELQAADFAARRVGAIAPWMDVAAMTTTKTIGGVEWQIDEDVVSVGGLRSDVRTSVDDAFGSVAIVAQRRVSSIFAGAPPPASGSPPARLTIRAVSRYVSPDYASVLFSVDEDSPQAAHGNTWYDAVTVDLANGQPIAAAEMLDDDAPARIAEQLAAANPTPCAQSGNPATVDQNVFGEALTQTGDSAVAVALGPTALQFGFDDYALQGGLGCHPVLALGYDALDGVIDPRFAPDTGSVHPGTEFSAAPVTYVGLGDSYSAGEGTNDYFDDVSQGDDTCHRSPLAYASLLGAVESKNQFRACSGATIHDLEGTYKTEAAQPKAITTGTDLVTLSAGGDDVGFADVLAHCLDPSGVGLNHDSDCFPAINKAYAKLFDDSSGGPNDLDTKLDKANCGSIASFRTGTCASLLTNAELATTHPGQSLYQDLSALLREIRTRAPRARIIVLGYPSLFPSTPYSGADLLCGGVLPQWQQALAQADGILNGVVAEATFDSGVEFIDPTNAFGGHDSCNSQQRWINDLSVHCAAGNGTQHFLVCSESFHPNREGYRQFRTLVYQQIEGDLLAPVITVKPATNVTVASGTAPGLSVPAGTATLDVHVRWPGSTIRVTLRDPSGRRYSAGELPASISRFVTATSEDWVIQDPKPGSWSVQLFGASVASGGEPVAVTAQQTTHRFGAEQHRRSGSSLEWIGVCAAVVLVAGAVTVAARRRKPAAHALRSAREA